MNLQRWQVSVLGTIARSTCLLQSLDAYGPSSIIPHSTPHYPLELESPSCFTIYLSPASSLLERAGRRVRIFVSCGLDTSGFGFCLHHLLTMRSWGLILLLLVEFLVWKGGKKMLLRVLKFKDDPYTRPNMP